MVGIHRAHVRPWRADDVDAVLRAARGGEDLARQFAGIAVVDRASARAYLDVLTADDPYAGHLAIVADGAVVGDVGATASDPRHGIGWVSCWLAPHARGRGLAVRALVAAAATAFARGAERLELGHRTDNAASCRVASRAGFAIEGVERARLRYGDRRYDVERHARLRTDAPPEADPLPIEPDGSREA